MWRGDSLKVEWGQISYGYLPLAVKNKSNIFKTLIIVLKWKKVRILKKGLKITFINPNTEEQIVQAMAGVLAYNLAENDENIKFDYNSNSYQNSRIMEEQKLEL